MKKGFLFLMMGLMVWGFSLKALADTRVDSMSMDVREINDIDLIWIYPNMVMDYKNTVDFRLGNLTGGGTSEWGGAIVGMSDNLGVWGVYVNRPKVQYNDAMNLFITPLPLMTSYWSSLGSYFFGSTPIFGPGTTNNAIDAFYANKFGDVNLGGRITYDEDFLTNIGGGPFGNNIQSENWGFSLGAGLTDWAGFKQANFHVDYDVNFFTSDRYPYFLGTIPAVENQGVQSLRLGTLMDYTVAKDTNLRLFGDVKFDEYKWVFWFAPIELDYEQKNIDLGAAFNQTVFDGKATLTSGLILDYYGAKELDITNGQVQDSWDALWNLGAEAEVSDWLTLRTGVEFPLFARDWGAIFIPGNGNFYFNNQNIDTVAFSTGAGINFENLTLDLKVNVSSLDNAINNVNPGQGLFTAGNMLTVGEADLKYKF